MRGIGMAGLSTPAQISNKPAMLDTKTLLDTNTEIEQAIKDYGTQQLNDGKTTETTVSRTRMLNQVAKVANLNEPEQVKEWLRKAEWQNSTKIRFIDIYTGFLTFNHRTWNPPRYAPNAKLPFILTEEEIDALISGSAKTISTALQTLKETAMRIGELTYLKWIDIDAPHKTINITPEKGSNPRKLPISDKLIGMLNTLPRIHGDNVFNRHKQALRENFDDQRKRIAERLNNPRLKQISFHTFRHWKATIEYHNTKDIMHVRQMLGHKGVNNTLIYITLESSIYLQTDEHFTCRIAYNEQEEAELIEAGFTHINNRDNLAFYRKRK